MARHIITLQSTSNQVDFLVNPVNLLDGSLAIHQTATFEVKGEVA